MSLQERFPDLRPVKSAPALFRINGCGMGLYGRRDVDAETGTYVSTYALCFLFVPVLAFSAYRVADSNDGGWYFLGKERLSTFAKAWNVAVILFAVGGLGYLYVDQYWNSPSYLYARKLKQADEQLQRGEVTSAAGLYREVMQNHRELAPAVVTSVSNWLAGPALSAAVTDAQAMLQVAEAARILGSWPPPADGVYHRGLEIAQARAGRAPQEAVTLISLVAAGAADSAEVDKFRRPWLEAWHDKDPANLDAAGQLAVCYESASELEKCQALLAPFGAKLVGTEGGRIWGQLLASQGKFAESCDYLMPYCTARLDQLHQAEKAAETAAAHVEERALAKLNSKGAPKEFYRDYEHANEARQREMVNEFMVAELRQDAEFNLAQDKLRSASSVVPVALDLGMALLRRAQQATSAEERQRDLERAEKTFLAVGGVAGESDTYRLNLGQVYYWLGKHAEGRKLFDELLAANDNKYDVAIGVIGVLREVGATAEARTLCEATFERETGENKYMAAQMRVLLHTDLDDEIAWLQRCDPASKDVQASLCSTRAQKAIREGREQDGIADLQKAVDIYAQLNESAATLNNSALCYFMLYSASGKTEYYEQAVARLEKAIALLPGDSILLSNYTGAKLSMVMMDIIGDRLQWQTLRRSGDVRLLSVLYDDTAARDTLTNTITTSAAVKQTLENARRLQVLMPKSVTGYNLELQLLQWTNDASAAGQLLERIRAAQVDLTDQQNEIRDLVERKNIEKNRGQIQEARKRAEQALTRARESKHPATLAIAVRDAVTYQIAAAAYGLPNDSAATVALAEEGVAAHPCLISRQTLIAALCEQVNRDLAAADTSYAQAIEQHRHLLGDGQLLGMVAAQPGALRDKLLALPRFATLITAIKSVGERLPYSMGQAEWQMLRQVDPAAAERSAQSPDKSEPLIEDAEDALSAPSPAVFVDRYLLMLRRGDEAGAKAVQELAKNADMALPFVD